MVITCPTDGSMTSRAGFGIHPEHQQQRDQRRHDDEFTRHQVAQLVVAVAHRPRHHPLIRPQDVDGRQHQRRRREDGERGVAGEGADQHQELADERGQAGQRKGGQPGDQERAREYRRHLLNAAVVGDDATSPAGHQESRDQEQGRRGDAVVDHVQRRSGLALAGHDEDAEDDEPEVRDRRVGDEPHDVGLADGDDGAVDDADDGQRDDQRLERARRVGEQLQAVAQHAERADLVDDGHHQAPRSRGWPRRRRRAASGGTATAAP